MARKRIKIVKGSGEMALFSRRKIFDSLKRAGAPRDVATKIADQVAKEVEFGMTTKQIYQKAFALLKQSEQPGLAARYSLKNSIMQLGPTGYPFEQFLAALLAYDGYKVHVGQSLQGRCVRHEVDVVAEIDSKRIMIEAKFHNTRGYTTDVKVPLYIHSRFEDIKAAYRGKSTLQQWIVTNTKFSDDAICYGECMNITMVGWRYPSTGGLEALIEESGLHPITCLTSLSIAQKHSLLRGGTVLCKDLAQKRSQLHNLGLSKAKTAEIIAEASQLCFSKA